VMTVVVERVSILSTKIQRDLVFVLLLMWSRTVGTYVRKIANSNLTSDETRREQNAEGVCEVVSVGLPGVVTFIVCRA
jgi:hypothetical protein